MGKISVRIGIDPDLVKSGVAMVYQKPGIPQYLHDTSTLSFFDLIEYFEKHNDKMLREEICVMLEAGWLNKISNYHKSASKSIAGRIGKNVGENHAVGKLIEEYLKRNNINYKLVKPSTKKWDAKLFKQITKWEGRTNSEMRDATRAAW
jgi:hypothetical protein